MPDREHRRHAAVWLGVLPMAVAALLSAAAATAQVMAPNGSDELNLQHTRPGKELPFGRSLSGKYLAGRHAFGERATKEAADYLLEVLEADPDNPNILGRAFGMLVADGKVAEALPLGERLVALDPGAGVAQLTLAVDALKRGDKSKAARHVAALPAGGPNVLIVPLLTAWVMVAQGDAGGALETVRQNLDLSQLGLLREFQLALMADVGGLKDRAGPLYEQVVGNRDNMTLKVATSYASFLARSGRRDDAVQVMSDYLESNPGSPAAQPMLAALKAGQTPPAAVATAADGVGEVLYTVASLLAREQTSPTAQLYVQLALYLRPGDTLATLLLAQVHEAGERYGDAIATLNRVVADPVFGWTARLSIAQNLSRLDKREEAIASLKSMVDERPDRTDAAETLGDLLRQAERFPEAIQAYSTAIGRLPQIEDEHWRLLYGRGIAYERTKQWPKAEADFLKALELEPEQPLVLNYLAYSWVELGTNLDRAKQMIMRAVQLRPRDGYIVDSLGWVLYRLGEYDGAVGALERAVELQPSDPVINDHLGDAYWVMGRPNEARFQWQRALSFKPEPEVKEQIEGKIAGKGRPEKKPVGRGG